MATDSTPGPLHVDTVVVSSGPAGQAPGSSVNVPVELTSTYAADGAVNYARVGNPTWNAFESALGELEGGSALVHASGMGAISAALSLVAPGGTVVAPDQTYNGTSDLLLAFEQAGGSVCACTRATPRASSRHSRGQTCSGSSPRRTPSWTYRPRDRLARSRTTGVTSVVDNTLPTPLLSRPLGLGADVVVHSVTKYLSGHSDVVLGATVVADTERGRALGERLSRHRTLHGAIAGPLEVYLALRGLRTLSVRFERACANAAVLAERLPATRPWQGCATPGRVRCSPSTWPATPLRAERLCAATPVWLHSTSLGGVESQLERRRRHPSESAAVPESLVRLSVGIEHVDDLWADLEQALEAV